MNQLRYVQIILLWLLVACAPGSRLAKIESSEYILSESANIADDSSTAATIRPYSENLRSAMEIILAQSTHALEKGLPESPLGNFVADLCLMRGKQEYTPDDGRQIDFAFFNNGGLRKALPAGSITKGDVFELMPFENEMVILTLSGESVKKTINFMASLGGAPVSGLQFTIRNKEAINIEINGLAFNPSKSYKVLTSDYLANGGDNYTFLSEAIKRESVGVKIRDAIIQHLYIMGKTEDIVDVSIDGRIKNE